MIQLEELYTLERLYIDKTLLEEFYNWKIMLKMMIKRLIKRLQNSETVNFKDGTLEKND